MEHSRRLGQLFISIETICKNTGIISNNEDVMLAHPVSPFITIYILGLI